MKATYYKDSLRSYMIIPCPPEAQTRGYQYRMLGMNRIDGLVPCSLRHIDGTGYLYYDITGKQSMAALYEGRKISGAEFFKLLEAVVNVAGALSEYLLDEQFLVLSAEQVFYDLGTGGYCFVYFPGEIVKPEIFRFLADGIDGIDKRAAAAAYRLCPMAEGDRQALKEALKEETERKDLPDPWEEWKKAGSTEAVLKQNRVQPEKSDAHSEGGSRKSEGASDKGQEPFHQAQAAAEKDISAKQCGKPLFSAAQLLIRIALIVLSLAGAGGLIAVNLLVYITQREKRLCGAGAVLLLVSAVLITAEMIIRVCKEKKRSSKEKETQPVYSVSDEKDLPVFGTVNGEDYRLHEEDAGDTVRLNEQDIAGRLYGRDRGNRIDLRTLPLTIGKAQSFADVVLPDPSISRVHARIYRGEEGTIEIRDLDSTNGTWVNGVRIGANEKVRVHRGDEIRFGNVEYEYR